jgi:methylmalonyl-CoA decarboxylase subunit alpha
MSDDKSVKETKLAELKERRQKIAEMGGKERIDAQGKKGKLSARARINALLDKETFHETGMFARNRNVGAYEDVAADGVVTGYGEIDGRKVYIYAQDFTSMGGTMAEMQSKKICNLMDSAIKVGCPVIALNDSGGARIQDGVNSLAGYGQIFRRNVLASGIVPQICAILGPTAGGGVYSPALMDFIFMVKGISYAYITGPRVVKATTGQDISDEELGGAAVAQKKSGVACRSEENEEECFQNIRELLGYLPQSNREKLPPKAKTVDKANRTDKTLFEIVPDAPNRPYDMKKIIARVFDKRDDDKKNYFELFPLFATNIITCFTRLNGWSVGIIANQPMSKAGCLDIDACD